MQVVAVGSVALDTIRIHGACHAELLGGSASYFGLAAAHFGPVGLVGVVGDDFPEAHVELLRSRGADLRGLERRAAAAETAPNPVEQAHRCQHHVVDSADENPDAQRR